MHIAHISATVIKLETAARTMTMVRFWWGRKLPLADILFDASPRANELLMQMTMFVLDDLKFNQKIRGWKQ